MSLLASSRCLVLSGYCLQQSSPCASLLKQQVSGQQAAFSVEAKQQVSGYCLQQKSRSASNDSVEAKQQVYGQQAAIVRKASSNCAEGKQQVSRACLHTCLVS